MLVLPGCGLSRSETSQNEDNTRQKKRFVYLNDHKNFHVKVIKNALPCRKSNAI